MSDWKTVLKGIKLIPVVVIDDADTALPLAEAMLAGGINVIEVTFRTPAAAESIRRITHSLPEMLVGAGTVVSEHQAKQAIDAGVHFGLAPGLNPKIVECFKQADVLFIPGVMTASEIEQALALDCELLKFFPAEQAGGVTMLKALSAPYQHLGVRFCPTGGVNLNNMHDYLQLPTVAAIGGTWIARQDDINAGHWSVITRNVEEAMGRIAV